MTFRSTFATATHAGYIEGLYEQYKNNPQDVEESWRKFFDGYEFALATVGISPSGLGSKPSNKGWDSDPVLVDKDLRDSAKVEAFINAYRRLGHLAAHLSPLSEKNPIPDNMKPDFHGLVDVHSEQKFHPSNFGAGHEMTFAEIVDKLTQTYCGHIGADFREMNDIDAVLWLQEKMESCQNKPPFSAELKKHILQKLAEAEGFETFLQARYLGQKRFSGEGVESVIPLLDIVLNDARQAGVQELCFGMAHRGRLNILVNIMGKPYERMLLQFEGSEFNAFDIDGDVKYHLGHAGEVSTFSGQKVRVYLAPNPSHLEAINPVLEGFTRSRQEVLGDWDSALPVLLHGDASFIGQGIVAETLNLSQLEHYKTGGTIHIITNNQIGFTTEPKDSRSCTYSSDISKIIRAPVLHVNADNPEAVAWVAQLAVMYRQKFHRDIVVDLVGYRRHGHNETDEPSFTQPTMYQKIAAHPTVFKLYGEQLAREGLYTEQEVTGLLKAAKDRLQAAYETIHSEETVKYKGEEKMPPEFEKVLRSRKVGRDEVMQSVKTQVSEKRLKTLAQTILKIPESPSFTVHPKMKRLLESRSQMLEKNGAVDWGFAEILAFASLSAEGYSVRLSGQDCKRGTFSSRHAVMFDYKTGEAHELLKSVGPGPVSIINSPLSELGCLGFEFGYSLGMPRSLVLWEAQFGDFVNGAQIILDQFLVASEAKWNQTSGLVLMLPHGYEGMGPEHSSARPERFLQCSGNLNIQVCNVSTPAQLFHLLRRQMLRDFRKPLVLMTPKSLLRHPKVVSNIDQFTKGRFDELLDDELVTDRSKVKKLILCTGKIYYELAAAREAEKNFSKVPLLRCEQLYPFPKEKLLALLKPYTKLQEVLWVQEEPTNMGPWNFIRPRLQEILGPKMLISYVGRKNSGSTAEGSGKAHQLEQKRILEQSLTQASKA